MRRQILIEKEIQRQRQRLWKGGAKSYTKQSQKERQRKDKFDTPIKCKLCDKHFEKFVDLEKHVKENHDNREEFQSVINVIKSL